MANGENGNGNGKSFGFSLLTSFGPTLLMILVAWLSGFTDMRSDQRLVNQKMDALRVQVDKIEDNQRLWIGKINQETLDRSLADEVLRGKVQECVQRCSK